MLLLHTVLNILTARAHGKALRVNALVSQPDDRIQEKDFKQENGTIGFFYRDSGYRR